VKKISWVILSVLILIGSFIYYQKSYLTPTEYFEFVNDPSHGLIQKSNDSLYMYELQYMPVEELALINARGSNDIKAEYKKYLSESNNNITFKLKIFAGDKKTDPLEYKLQSKDEQFQRLSYFSSSISDDGIIITSNDTIPCKLSVLERTYKTSPYLIILFQFDSKKSLSKNFNFVLNNKVSGMTNIFSYNKKDLDTPKIKI